MKLLYLSLEFLDPLFSGNGVLARSQVRGLLKRSEVTQVTVCCGRWNSIASKTGANEVITLSSSSTLPPQLEDTFQRESVAIEDPELTQAIKTGKLRVRWVPVSVWHTLDRPCSWIEFAELGADAAYIASRGVDVVLVVDWSALALYERVAQRQSPRDGPQIPMVFLNFRVYHAMPDISEDDREFYRRMETRALEIADDSRGAAICLCRGDKESLTLLMDSRVEESIALFVNFPCLRDEAFQRSLGFPLVPPSRRFITCIVRLAPEKGAHRFAEMIEELGSDFLHSQGLVPFLCGAVSNKDYGTAVHQRLKRACPFSKIESFLNSTQLLNVLSETLINVHPATYEAYGMTIIEAASMGAASLVHYENVGARDLLSSGGVDHFFETDFTEPRSAARRLREILGDRVGIKDVGARARVEALTWDEQAHAGRIYEILASIGVGDAVV